MRTSCLHPCLSDRRAPYARQLRSLAACSALPGWAAQLGELWALGPQLGDGAAGQARCGPPGNGYGAWCPNRNSGKGKRRMHVLLLAKRGWSRLTMFRHARCGARRRSWSAPHRVQTKCSSRRCRRCWTSRSSRCPSASGMPSTPPSPSRAAPSRPPRRSSTRGSARRWLAQS